MTQISVLLLSLSFHSPLSKILLVFWVSLAFIVLLSDDVSDLYFRGVQF